jgi:hypothetical protein
MPTRTLGTMLPAGMLLVAGLAGVGAAWAAWPRNSATSPLMTLLAVTWGCSCLVSAVLTWRRSRFAGLGFIVAVGCLLVPARLVVPGGELFMPALAVITLVAFLGYRFLRVRAAA